MLIVNAKIQIPWSEFRISYARSSGPGGQNVNKVNTKAVLDWTVSSSPSLSEPVRQRFLARFASKLSTDGRVVIASDEFRQQEANLKACYDKLKNMLLEVAEPPKIRRPTKPTRGSQERRLGEKRLRAKTKQQRQRFDND